MYGGNLRTTVETGVVTFSTVRSIAAEMEDVSMVHQMASRCRLMPLEKVAAVYQVNWPIMKEVSSFRVLMKCAASSRMILALNEKCNATRAEKKRTKKGEIKSRR